MVHQYKNNGYNIVLDVNSGAIHVVDDVSYDVIALYEDHTPEEIVAELSGKYSEAKKPVRKSLPWQKTESCLQKTNTKITLWTLRNVRQL